MSGLFSSKTTSTSTSSTKVPQNFQNFLDTSLNKALAAGSKGFTAYNAPRIAELSSNEQAGIAGAGAQAGMYQPVINMALQANQDMFNNAVPTQTQLGNFINPYVNYVLGNSLDRLQEQSDINMTKIGSTAGMSGAFGGLRHGVLEGANLAELLKSARDLSGSTYADAYDKGMTNWFRTQENQRSNIGSALDLVRGGQAYNTQDIQNLMNTGLTERTRNQAGLDFGYSEFMREDQDDLNKASFLSTIAAQYPRDLFTRTNKTVSETQDSPIKTLAGIGLAAAGIMSGNPAALAGLGVGSSALGSGAGNTVNPVGMPMLGGDSGGYYTVPRNAKGGLIKGYANGGKVSSDPLGFFGGGLLAMGQNSDFDEMDEDEKIRRFGSKGTRFIQDYRNSKGLSRKPQVQPAVQPKPFDWDTFLTNMRFSDFTRPSQNTVNPGYLSNLSLPQGLGSYVPMTQQMNTPLNAGVPGPGGPAGLNGNNLNRFAGGGRIGPESDEKRAERLVMGKLSKEEADREFINKAFDMLQKPKSGSYDPENGDNWELNPPSPDDSNWVLMNALGLTRKPKERNPLLMSPLDNNQFSRYGEELGDLSHLNADINLLNVIKKQQDYVKRKPLLTKNDELEAKISGIGQNLRSGDPLNAMAAHIKNQMIQRPAPMLHRIKGDDTPEGEPAIFDDRLMEYERFLNNLDPNKAVIKNVPDVVNKYEPIGPGSPPEELNKRRSSAPGYWPGGVEYSNGGLIKKYQEGGKVFIEGGKGFSKRQDRLPPDTIDPLDALIYGLPNPNPPIIPDKNADRSGPLDFSPTSGTTSKAALKRNPRQTEVPFFNSPQDIIDTLPSNPNEEVRSFTSTPMPSYTKSRMWEGVNEDVFMDGTFKNEQDNSINDKNLSLNKDSLAFGQHQYLPSTWNTYATRFMKENPELAKKLGVFKVKESELAKFRGKKGDPGIAKVIPSFAARDYVYRNYYLPDSVNALKKAKLPVTELNLYLAHHLGQEGAVKAIPLMNDPKYANKTMKRVLLDAGLTTAANSKGNPWGDTVAKYKQYKSAAYEPYRAKYRGETIDEVLARPYTTELSGEPVPFIDSNYISDESRNDRLNRKRTYRDEQRNLLRNDLSRGVNAQQMDGFIPGGMGFNKGGIVKKFNKGGVSYSDSVVLPLEDWEELWKERYGDSQVIPLESWDGVMPPPPDVTADEIDLYRSIPKGNKPNLTPNKVNVMGPDSYTVTVPQKQPRGPNILRMPENRADWKTREPGMFEKVRERTKDPKGIGYWDDFLSQIPFLDITPSTSGKVPTDQKIVLPLNMDKVDKFTPNPNLYSDPLGEWGNSGDPVDNFYNEMSDMIGTPQGGAPEMPEAAQVDGSGNNGGGGDSDMEDDPEAAMLKQLYRDKLKEYIDAQNKPAKKPVFGMFDNVNEPLLKLGLSLLASKGSFGEALGEAGLASLADRDKEQLKKGQEASEKLQEIVKMRYTNAMIDSLDPKIKAELARQAQAAKLYEKELQLDFEREKAGISAKETRVNEILKAIMRWQIDREGEPVPQEWLDIVNNAGYKLSNPEDKGTSLFD